MTGLANQLMRGVSGDPKHVDAYRNIVKDMEREQNEWIASLRAAGVKASHPDDGWVNRTNNTMQFVYPQFNDGAGVGDLVALGSPKWGCVNPRHRIVRLTGVSRKRFISVVETWAFEPVDAEEKIK